MGALSNPPIICIENINPNCVPVAPNNWTVTYGIKNEKKKNPILFQKMIRSIGIKSGVISIWVLPSGGTSLESG